MTCQESRERLWEGESDPALVEHLAQCEECRRLRDEIGAIRGALRQPTGVAIDRLGRGALEAVVRKTERTRWRPAMALLATAATVIVAILTFVPQQTEALSLHALTTQHRLCLIEGHNKNFRCGSEAAFAEMTIKELGLTPRPFEAPKDTFMKGDICRIGGAKVAHALLNVEGKQVSYFRLYDASETLLGDGAWTEAGAGVWWQKRDGRFIVMRRFAEKDFGLYTGEMTLADIRRLWNEKEPTG